MLPNQDSMPGMTDMVRQMACPKAVPAKKVGKMKPPRKPACIATISCGDPGVVYPCVTCTLYFANSCTQLSLCAATEVRQGHLRTLCQGRAGMPHNSA